MDRPFPVRRVVVLVGLQLAMLAVLAGWWATARGEGHHGGVERTSDSAAATRTPRARTDRFDVQRALRTVRLQLAAGQRPAGSPQLRRVAEELRARMPHGAFEDVPDHPGLRNVVGELAGAEPAIVVGAHYDTEYHPKGFVGANDAAAAVGAVVEIARALQRTHRPATAPAIRFVLFDGEEEPHPTDDFYDDALRGSKAYVNAHHGETRAMLLLDYIGNHGVQLPREASSTPALWRKVRAAATKIGVGAVFPPGVETGITDDHAPFLRAGIAAVDFIDWGYPAKDTIRDNYGQLSAASIDAVGETVVELLRTWD
ncbi:MAG TPA: M28 family peptidase [Baekduia sp.]|nr:M28 family peptidase [Baekduia sp.]